MRQVPSNSNIHSVLDFKKAKQQNKKISFVTCYDYWSANIIAHTDIDCILVGDSLAMTMYGHDTTIPATIELIQQHTQAVTCGTKNKFIVADMPFLSYRKGIKYALNVVEQLMQAGAQAIKLEGCAGNTATIHHIVESGVPVMGHIGLTPQSVYTLGGYHVQGKTLESENNLYKQALELENAGCFALVLECIPNELAKKITEKLSIPTIGIGAGKYTDGQILVLQDLLGVYNDINPKFVKKYLQGFELIKDALNTYNDEVKNSIFPSNEYSFHQQREKNETV